MVWNIILLIIGMVLMIKGADEFVDGASSIAKKFKIPTLVIGLTLVSIGTSMPELSVSINAAVKAFQNPETNNISFGNVIGSNIFNTFVVIGAASLFTPMLISKDIKKIDLPILMGIYVILALFAFVISPKLLEQWESIIIFALMFIYIGFLLFRSRKEIKKEKYDLNEISEINIKSNLMLVLFGLAGVIGGGTLVVDNAEIIATTSLGMDPLLVGLTVVSIGTSLPELITSIVAAKKGENDIAVGNAIGSSLFNIVLILGLSSTINPMSIGMENIVDISVMFASAFIIFIMAFGKAKVTNWKGIILLIIYVAYFTYIVLRNYGII